MTSNKKKKKKRNEECFRAMGSPFMCIYLIPNICCWIDYINNKNSDKYNNFSSEFLKWISFTVIQWFIIFVVFCQTLSKNSFDIPWKLSVTTDSWRRLKSISAEVLWRQKRQENWLVVTTPNLWNFEWWVNLFMSLVQPLSFAIGFCSCIRMSQD